MVVVLDAIFFFVVVEGVVRRAVARSVLVDAGLFGVPFFGALVVALVVFGVLVFALVAVALVAVALVAFVTFAFFAGVDALVPAFAGGADLVGADFFDAVVAAGRFAVAFFFAAAIRWHLPAD